MRTSVWRKHAQKWIDKIGLEEAAKQLGHSIECLQARLADTQDDFDPVYLRRCVEMNPTYTLEEIAENLEVPEHQLREIMGAKYLED